MDIEELKRKLAPVLRSIEKELSIEENTLEFFKVISGGFSTMNIQVKTTEKSYLLRSYPGKPDTYSSQEFEIMKCVMNSKCSHIAPKAYLCDDSKSIYEHEYCLFEFLTGYTPKNQMYLKGKKDLISNLGKILRNIHDSLPNISSSSNNNNTYLKEAPKEDYTLMGQWDEKVISKNILNPSEMVQKVMKEHGGFEDFKKSTTEIYQKAIDVTKEFIESPHFQNASRSVLIHNDYHINNMLFFEETEPQRPPKIIDWEHSRFGCIYEDIAMFISIGGLEEEENDFFLKGYFGEEEDEDEDKNLDRKLFEIFLLRKKFFVFSFLLLLVNEKNGNVFGMYIKGLFNDLEEMIKKYES